jgi:hypothetical protein
MMAIESIEGVLFIEGELSPSAFLRGARALVERTEASEQLHVVPLDEEQEQMLKAGDTTLFVDNGRTIFYTSEHMSREVDPDWLLQLILSNPEVETNSQINLLAVPSGGGDTESNWSFLTALLPLIVEIYQPALAMCNGMSTDEDIDHLPSSEELKPGVFPPVITPWMYLGAGHLSTSLKKKLLELDVFRSEPLGDGWLLQVVAKYADKPSRDIIKQLKALGQKSSRYTHTQ